MSDYTPDMWVVIEVNIQEPPLLKIVGTWAGGYISGDSWRVNSGVEGIIEEEDHYLFKGYSGSMYRCHKGSYGIAGAGNYYLAEQIKDSLEVVLLSLEEFEERYVKEVEDDT